MNIDYLDFYTRKFDSHIVDMLFREDFHIISQINCVEEMQHMKDVSTENLFGCVRSIPALVDSKVICHTEYEYIQDLLYAWHNEEEKLSNDKRITRLYAYSREHRKEQNLFLRYANQFFLKDKELVEQLQIRLFDDNAYWKSCEKIAYRFTALDFMYGGYGTCLDTAIIASCILEQRGMKNYILNIRGVKGAHSIVVVMNSPNCISNFSLKKPSYLSHCLSSFDIDSIIIGEREIWWEDIARDEELYSVFCDLQRQGGFRFYSHCHRKSFPSRIIFGFFEIN